MRTLLFTLTLALYGFSAMDMHEWVRVPEVVLHFPEHHSGLGHTDGAHDVGSEHDGDHSPFDEGCDEVFCACSGAIFLPMQQGIVHSLSAQDIKVAPEVVQQQPKGYTGSAWNPPKSA